MHRFKKKIGLRRESGPLLDRTLHSGLFPHYIEPYDRVGISIENKSNLGSPAYAPRRMMPRRRNHCKPSCHRWHIDPASSHRRVPLRCDDDVAIHRRQQDPRPQVQCRDEHSSHVGSHFPTNPMLDTSERARSPRPLGPSSGLQDARAPLLPPTRGRSYFAPVIYR